MEKAAKAVRVCTVAPIMACGMLTWVFSAEPAVFDGTLNFVFGLVFLTVLPLLAYPLQPYIPKFKERGRSGQRELAMIFAVAGYLLGCIISFIRNAPGSLWVIYLEYLLSGLCILVFNKAFHLKASGHACGVGGPICLLHYFQLPILLPGVLLIFAVCWSSLKMERHTWPQLFGGACIPVAVMAILSFVF